MKDKSYDDRLAELEAVILQYYLNKGFKLYKDQKEGDAEWSFDIEINSRYKRKQIRVVCFNHENFIEDILFKTTKEMFNAAIERFAKADVV